jgi:hypothetical protein
MRYGAMALAAALLCGGAAQAQDKAFAPGGATVSLAAATASARVQIQTGSSSPNVRVYNSGTVAVFVQCGDVTVVATTAAGMPIAPGTVEVVACPQPYIAGIVATGTATLYATAGSGI